MSGIVYDCRTTVVSVVERFRKVHVKGFGTEAEFRDESLGYYMHLDGSYESLPLGPQKPALKTGDIVQITIMRL